MWAKYMILAAQLLGYMYMAGPERAFWDMFLLVTPNFAPKLESCYNVLVFKMYGAYIGGRKGVGVGKGSSADLSPGLWAPRGSHGQRRRGWRGRRGRRPPHGLRACAKPQKMANFGTNSLALIVWHLQFDAYTLTKYSLYRTSTLEFRVM